MPLHTVRQANDVVSAAENATSRMSSAHMGKELVDGRYTEETHREEQPTRSGSDDACVARSTTTTVSSRLVNWLPTVLRLSSPSGRGGNG